VSKRRIAIPAQWQSQQRAALLGRAGVAEDDLSEKTLGAVCFGGFKVAHAIFKSSKTTTGVLRAEGTGAVKGD